MPTKYLKDAKLILTYHIKKKKKTTKTSTANTNPLPKHTTLTPLFSNSCSAPWTLLVAELARHLSLAIKLRCLAS